MIFEIIFLSINGHSYTFFKNILNHVQSKGKGEINMAQRNYSKIVFRYYNIS